MVVPYRPIPTLQAPSADPTSRERYLFDHRVSLNWYPRVKAVRARGIAVEDDHADLNSAKLTKEHVALLDLDAIYFELLRFKAERGWNNLNITRGSIASLLANTEWYDLQIPASEMAFDSFERVRLWQEIAISLLKKYCDRYYTFRKREWELPHLEYQLLSPDDPNFAGYSDGDEEHFYRVLVDQSREDIIADIERLKEAIEAKVRFCETIKEIEERLSDEAVTLDSFIISTTPAPLVRNRWGKTDEWLAARHILFPDIDADYPDRFLAPLSVRAG